MTRLILSLLLALSLTACSYAIVETPNEWSSIEKIEQVIPTEEFEEKQPEEEPTTNFEIDIAKKKEIQKQEESRAENQEIEQRKANETKEKSDETERKDQEKKKSVEIAPYEKEVVQLVNQERMKRGYSPLIIDEKLTRVARKKSADMRDNNYFSHQSPTYGSPFEMMKKEGIEYTMAGENIAAGQRTPKQVMEAWMNSEGHRKNILNPEFTHIGVGFQEGGSYGTYWTQLFIKK